MPGKNEYITEIQRNRIKECMDLCGLKQKDIAEKLNYTPQHISYVVNGKRSLSNELAINLADLFSSMLPPESIPVEIPFSELSDDEQAEYIDIDGIDKKEIAKMPYDIKASLADDIDEKGFVTVFYDTPYIDYRYLLGEMDYKNINESYKAESIDSLFFSGIKAILHRNGYNIAAAGCHPAIMPARPAANSLSGQSLKQDKRKYKITKVKTGEMQYFSAAELYFLFRDFAESICGIMDRTFYKKQFENAEIEKETIDEKLPFDGDFIPPE